MPRSKGSNNRAKEEIKGQLKVNYTILNCSIFSLFIWNPSLITDSIKVI